jgi:hypothetical protein
MHELRDFWMSEWSRFLESIGRQLDPHIFESQSYFYVLRNESQIIGVMSSTWQNIDYISPDDAYYSAWPESVQFLKRSGIKNFHKIGMLIAKRELIPRNLRMAQTIIGGAINFIKTLPECEAVVSFPRRDIRVFRACNDWGATPIKTDIFFNGTRVGFIFARMADITLQHPDHSIYSTVCGLWNDRIEYRKTISEIAA